MAVERSGAERVEPLACGRDAADVWDHAEAGVLAAEPLRPPPSVLEQVMGAVVADLRPHELLALGPDAWLGRPTAEAALRHVVDTMDGLRARRCRIEQLRAPDGSGDDPAAVWVRVTVAARFGVDLASVTARVRQMMISAGDRTLGVPIAGVDILVEDLWEEPA
jgi:hypothetical protein